MDYLSTNVTPKVFALADDRELTQRLLDLEESGSKLRVAAHSLSEDSSESSHMAKLIDELLENAAAITDCVDERYIDGDDYKAAQARFNRLIGLDLSTFWSSQSQRRETLAALLWPELSEPRARHNLRVFYRRSTIQAVIPGHNPQLITSASNLSNSCLL